jgi:hypothetical protein
MIGDKMTTIIQWVKRLNPDEKSWLALSALIWTVAAVLAVVVTATGRW